MQSAHSSVSRFVVFARACALSASIFGLAAGCGSSSSGGFANGDGGLLPDGAPAPSNGKGPNGTDAKGPAGLVLVTQSSSSGGGSTGYDGTVSAWFSDGATLEDANGCTVHTEGACRISICTKTDGGIAPSSLRSAGNLQVTGTASPASLAPKSDKSYDSAHAQSQNVPYLAPGATLSLKASGADVPAFEGSVKVGGAVQVSSPSISLFGTPLPKGDATFQWSGASASDTVEVLFSANAASDGSKTATVMCLFTGSSGTVPKAALDTLASPGGLVVGTANTATITAGETHVAFTALLPGAAGMFTK